MPLAILVESLTLLCALWFALRFLPAGADAAVPVLPYMIALVPFLWVPSLVAAVVAASLGLWLVCLIAALIAAATIGSQRPYWARMTKAKDAQGAGAVDGPDDAGNADANDGVRHAAEQSRLTVMTLNCRYGRADANAIVDLVRERRVRALALQELSADLVDRLEAAGLGTLLPYRSLGEDRPDDNGGFNGIWTAYEPAKAERCAVRIPAAQTPAVIIAMGDTLVRFVCAHTFSPMRGVRQWSEGIRGLAGLTLDTFNDRLVGHGDREDEWHGRTSGMRRVTVAMGDLNSGIDHASFRELLRAGWRDAALDEARGKRATFPRWLPWPRLVLDHVLVFEGGPDEESPKDASKHAAAAHRIMSCRDVRSYVIPSTDHLALVATLAW